MEIREVGRGLSRFWERRRSGGIVDVGVWAEQVWVSWEVWGVSFLARVSQWEEGENIGERRVCSVARFLWA